MSRLVSVLAFGWTAVCAWAWLGHTRLLAGLPLSPDAMDGLVLGGAVFTYNITAKPVWRRVGAAVAGVFAAGCWLALPGPQQWAALGPALLWGVYLGLPGRIGLRDNPWFKPLAVALAWAVVTVLLPLPVAQWGRWSGLVAERACFVFALALAYDLIDRSVDRSDGLRTLAGILGVQATLRVLDIALLGSGLLALANALSGRVSWPVAAAGIFVVLASDRVVRGFLRRFGPQQWLKPVFDALMLAQALLASLVFKIFD